MSSYDDEQGALQQLKSEWNDVVNKLGLNQPTDSGKLHPFGQANFSHSQHVMLSALSNMRQSLLFFQKMSDEQKSLATSAAANTTTTTTTTNTNTNSPVPGTPPVVPSPSPMQSTSSDAPTNTTTTTTTTTNDLRIYFKQWKDHKKTVMQQNFLNETLETSGNMLSDYCQEKERLRRTCTTGVNKSVYSENRSARIVQVLKRIVRRMKHQEMTMLLSSLNSSSTGGAKNSNTMMTTEEINNRLKDRLFQFFEYSQDNLKYYTTANSNYNLDVVLDENGQFHSVTLHHVHNSSENTTTAPTATTAAIAAAPYSPTVSEDYEAINRDLLEQLKNGRYDLFEDKFVLLFQQKNIMQNVPKCIVTTTTTTTTTSNNAISDLNSFQVFNAIEDEIWNRIRPLELTQQQQPQQQQGGGEEAVEAEANDNTELKRQQQQQQQQQQKRRSMINMGHGIIERKCEGISMQYYDNYSALIGIEEFSTDYTCPVLRLNPPVCVPVYVAQHINHYTMSDLSEHFTCRSVSSIGLSSALLLSMKRDNNKSTASNPTPTLNATASTATAVGGVGSGNESLMNNECEFWYASGDNGADRTTGKVLVFYAEEVSSNSRSASGTNGNVSGNGGLGDNLPQNTNAITVSRFSFTQVKQILPILQILRKQLRFNELFQSCFDPTKQGSTEQQQQQSVHKWKKQWQANGNKRMKKTHHTAAADMMDLLGDAATEKPAQEDEQQRQQHQQDVLRVEVTILPPLSIVLRLLTPSTISLNGAATDFTLHSLEVEVVNTNELKVYLYGQQQVSGSNETTTTTNHKIFSPEATQHVNEHANLPLLVQYLLTSK